MATAKCSAITRAGERCRLDATHGSFCYQHSPETVEERRRNARRGGRAGGNGRGGTSELVQVRREIRSVIGGVLSGRIERGTGSVMFMGYNALLRAVEVERKVRELEELEERITYLEARREAEGSRWHA